MQTLMPHFDLPFRADGKSFAVNEQDSLDEIVVCVLSVLNTRPGERQMLPKFGTPDPTFQEQPINRDAIVAAVTTWEPRAAILVEEHPDVLDSLIEHVVVQTSLRESQQ